MATSVVNGPLPPLRGPKDDGHPLERQVPSLTGCADVELIHHSDAGSQYTSYDFAQVLDDHGVLASIGSVGDAYDNAMAESFVDTFKTELIRDRVWRTRSQLELAILEYVAWFNDRRLHESLGDLPPSEFETLYAIQFA
ncbi:MAG: transposase [Solirubrobacterales bacterium]|nr:transposase [Solirubrobacterales bacterium]